MSVRCEHLFEDNVKFTIDKIKSAICPINEILLVKLFDPKMKISTNKSVNAQNAGSIFQNLFFSQPRRVKKSNQELFQRNISLIDLPVFEICVNYLK